MDMQNNLTILREKLNLSQDELGKRIGLSRFSVSNYESGKRNITDRVIADICREFNVNEDWFRTGEGDMFKTENDLLGLLGEKMDELDELDKKIFTNYLKLSPKHREVFKDYLRNLMK